MISFEERSVLSGNAPTAAEIAQSFNDGLTVAQANVSGLRWVNPRPRVTRIMITGAARANVTRAVGLLEINKDVPADQAAQIAVGVGGSVFLKLTLQSSDWSSANVQPYNAGINGPLAWWACVDQSQCASVTLTENQFPELAGRLQADENPIGPTTALTHPETLGNAAQNITSGVSSIMPVLIAITGLVLLVAAFPYIQSFFSATAPRRNPVPKKRKPRRRRSKR